MIIQRASGAVTTRKVHFNTQQLNTDHHGLPARDKGFSATVDATGR